MYKGREKVVKTQLIVVRRCMVTAGVSQPIEAAVWLQDVPPPQGLIPSDQHSGLWLQKNSAAGSR